MERRFWILQMTLTIAMVWISMKSSAEVCPAAIMKASPSMVIRHGHPFNLTCTLTGNLRPCHPRLKQEIKIYRQSYGKKTFMPGTSKRDSVTVQDLIPPGETTYGCWTCKHLCMTSVSAGFPPDQPRSVTCEQEGEVGKISCSWESGRETFIETSCTVQLLNRTNNETVVSKCSSQANQSLLLPVSIAASGEYTVVVRTSNKLGENVSIPYTFTYIDAVKPYPPSDITTTCDTPHTCTVTVHTGQDVQHFRLRYRATNESDWEQVEIVNNRSRTLHGLRPLSQYEFQAACKYVIDKGKWSNWSNVVTRETPEGAPQGRIYVWYKLHGINTAVTIFWKYMNLSEFRGQIQFYQVIFQDSKRHGIYIENTTNTWLSRNVDTEECVIMVSAHNSMGRSPPTSIRVTTHSLSGLPAPTNVAITSGPENITLRWELPSGIESAGDQIVVWIDPTEIDQSHTNWIIVPKHNRSVTISGHLKPYICYQFYIYLLWGGRAGLPGITQSSTQQRAPLTGPTFKYEVHKKNAILVTWEEIPAEEQMGCITHYSIYLMAASQTTRVIKVSSNQSTFYQYEIDNIEKNVQYSMEMTCWNEAGESPPSPLISAYVQPDVSEDIMVVVLVFGVISLLFICFLFSVSFAQQKVQVLLSRILPHWWSKPVPDPANCEWAKEFISSKGKMEILTNVASSVSDYDDEMETLEIEEMTSEDEESPSNVFSYKIDNAAIRITQEENRTSREDSESISPALTIELAQGGAYKSLDPDHPVDYLVHHDMNPSNYLAHHDPNTSNYLVHHDTKPSKNLVHNDPNVSNYLVHHDLKPSNYLVHHDIDPLDYWSHLIKPSFKLAQHQSSSDYLVHQDIDLLDSKHNVTASDYLLHHVRFSDYLAHHDIKPSDLLVHQEVQLLTSMVNHLKPSAHNESKVDYLPTNILTIVENRNKEQKDLLHHQLFLLSGERTENTISLDTVQTNTVQ